MVKNIPDLLIKKVRVRIIMLEERGYEKSEVKNNRRTKHS